MANLNEAARPGNAENGQTTPLSPRHRTVPILIVPGVMGTRLSDPIAGVSVWNPMGVPVGRSPGAMGANVGRLRDMRPLYPTNDVALMSSALQQRARDIDQFTNLITDFYDALCFSMADNLAVEFQSKGLKITPKVFCFGYDWRQSNTRSSRELGKYVAWAMDKCGGEQVILIAHSMGGLVSRDFCRNGGEGKVRALFLLASPSLGAVKPYFWLKEGMANSRGGMEGVLMKNVLLGMLFNSTTRDFMRIFPSAYQLMPTRTLAQFLPDPWLRFDATQTGYPESKPAPPVTPTPRRQFNDCKVPTSVLYQDLLTGLMDPPKARPQVKAHLKTAEAFHAGLTNPDGTVYMHPRTYCVYTRSLAARTLTAITVPFASATAGTAADPSVNVAIGGLQPVMNLNGDGSVPMASANPAVASPPFVDIHPLFQIEHGAVPNDPATRAYLIETIVKLF